MEILISFYVNWMLPSTQMHMARSLWLMTCWYVLLLFCLPIPQFPSLRDLYKVVSPVVAACLWALHAIGSVPSSSQGNGALPWIFLGTKEQIMAAIHLGPSSIHTRERKFKVILPTVVLSLHHGSGSNFFNLQDSYYSPFWCKIPCCRLAGTLVPGDTPTWALHGTTEILAMAAGLSK